MLDWDDDELASILWDEVPDTVVPYQEGNEGSRLSAAHKESINQLSSNDLEQKRALDKSTDIHGWGNESNLECYSNKEKMLSCLEAEPWKDPNITAAFKRSPHSIAANLVSSAGTSKNLSLSGGKSTQIDKDSESSQKQLEEHGNVDFVNHSWDEVGSLDELDQIFCNDDSIFGNFGFDGVDELWSGSIDAGYSLDKHFPSPVEPLISCPESLCNTQMDNQVRTDHQSNQPISDHDSFRDSMRCTETGTNSKILEARLDPTEKGITLSSSNSSCSSLNRLSNKVNKQKKNWKGVDHKLKGKSLLSRYGGHCLPENQLQQFGKQQDATSMVHSYPFSEQTQQNTSHHLSNKLSVPYENTHNQHLIVPVMPQHLICMGTFQKNHPAYEVSPGSSHLRTVHAPLKPLFMTPQEKIEKLRRRQQMQAMLAIKKQEQELGHKTPGLDIDCSISKIHCHDSQTETMDGTDKDIAETLIIHPCSDPGYSSQKEIPSNISKIVNKFPAENSALSQLQDIIAKLDSRVRLCIRDSLFRLATSAAQRHYPSDDLSANINNFQDEDYKLAKYEISNHNRSAAMVDVETETNPIDRTVAQLLFHRPFDVIAKQSDTPNLSVSTQPLTGAETESLVDLPTEHSKDNAELQHILLPKKKSESPFPAIKPQLGSEFLKSSCMDVSEKTSSREPGTEEESK